MEYFETYYYANVLHNVLDEPFEYLRSLHSWHEDRQGELFLKSFPKWSVLHDLARYVIEDLMSETLDDVALDAITADPGADLWVDRALKHHGIATLGFRSWLEQQGIPMVDVTEDHGFDYHDDLRLTGELDTLLTQLANEVFYVLFGNRALLARLNTYIAGIVGEIERDKLPEQDQRHLKRNGVPSRVTIPEWARRAVFFRDRGMCATCNRDLTGLVSVASSEHFDHIVPLAEGGINDVTNLQLLCSQCNLSKGRRPLSPSTHYEAWYSGDA